MERRGEAEGQTGGKYGWDRKSVRESKPAAAVAGWGWGWLGGGLKGHGLFANCGHLWPEQDRFNGYFNTLLNTTETWNAIVREASVLEICLQAPPPGERMFIHSSSVRTGCFSLVVSASIYAWVLCPASVGSIYPNCCISSLDSYNVLNLRSRLRSLRSNIKKMSAGD